MRKRILYIEDDPTAMQLVQMLLERSLPDVLVDVCTTEAGAETRLNTSCYDLIISDFSLAGATTGAMIAEKVFSRDPDQPFYLMSEYIGDHVKAEAARVGLELHGKFSTVPPAVFLARVTQLLQKRPCVEAAAIGYSADEISSNSATANLQSSTSDSPMSAIAEGVSRVAAELPMSPGTSSANADSPMRAGGAYRHNDRDRRARPQPIKLTSQHVLAARAALGRA